MRSARLAALTPLLLVLAACGGSDPSSGAAGGSGGATEGASATQYPLTVDNCSEQITIEQRPEKVMLIDFNVVGYIQALDAMDQVQFMVNAFNGDPAFELAGDPAAQEAVADLEQVGQAGAAVSVEEIAAADPDLIIGYETDTLTRAGLESIGVPLLILPGYCGDGHTGSPGENSLAALTDNVTFYGEVLDQQAAAAQAVEDLQARIDADAQGAPAEADGLTGATVAAGVDGSYFGVYGSSSVTSDLLQGAGVENAFSELEGRYNEVSIEELVDRDPDVILLLSSQDNEAELVSYFESLPGAEGLTAVQNDTVEVIPFTYGDPLNPYNVDGLEAVRDLIGS